ncbi:MAG: hypothetical protein ACK5HY_11755 [Parahaliea sp.]
MAELLHLGQAQSRASLRRLQEAGVEPALLESLIAEDEKARKMISDI